MYLKITRYGTLPESQYYLVINSTVCLLTDYMHGFYLLAFFGVPLGLLSPISRLGVLET